MTTDVVIDASTAAEMVTRTTTAAQLRLLLPPHAVPWVPDGLFDAEVISVPRRWELRSTLTPAHVAAAFQRLAGWRLRRATVLATETWTMRHNITFTDACYIALARRLDAALLTSDMRLVTAPNLPPVQFLHV